jgi:hypothetical protein
MRGNTFVLKAPNEWLTGGKGPFFLKYEKEGHENSIITKHIMKGGPLLNSNRQKQQNAEHLQDLFDN